MMKRKLLISGLLLLGAFALQAQTADELKERAYQIADKVKEGNKAYGDKRFQDALRLYEDAKGLDSTSFIADYNRAAALYQQERFQDAGQVLDSLSSCPDVENMKGDFFYNLGSCALAQGDYGKAVESFKETLRENPGDQDARESFAYAKEKLKDQQNQDQNKDQQDQNKNQNKDQQDQNKDQNKDQQDQNKDQQDQNKDQQDQNKDQQDQNKDQQNQPQDQQGQNQQAPGQQKISKQAAQQMLQAIQAKEKETQDKVKKEKAAAIAAKQKQKTKNW